MKTINLFLGFAFVGFGFMAISLIPELTEYVGQNLLAHFLFYVLCFIFTFIAWALSYVLIKERKHLSPFNRHIAKLEGRLPKHFRNNKQMDLKL